MFRFESGEANEVTKPGESPNPRSAMLTRTFSGEGYWSMTAPVVQQAGRARGERISMTAPVSQSAVNSGQWVIRFFMPAGRTMKSLPEPNDRRVRLVCVSAETIAVRRFSGSNNHRAITFHTDLLISTLRETGLEPIGMPAAWFYDPPWTLPMLRRNEVAVAVKANL